MFYAQIDPESKICISINQMSEFDDENFIEIDSYNTSYLGMIWDGEKFIDNPNPPAGVVPDAASTEPQPSETELSIMEAIADNYEATQEVKQGNLDIMSAIADMYESNDSSNSDTATS